MTGQFCVHHFLTLADQTFENVVESELKQGQVVNSSCFRMLLDMVKLSLIKAESSKAKFSLSLFVLFSCCSRYVAFVELIHLNDLLV